MRNNYRSLWAALVLFMITALTPEQRLKNTQELWEAVKRSDEARIKALLNQEADPNSKAQEGKTILMLAAYKGHLVTLKELIKAKAKVNAVNKHRNTALMAAAQKGHPEIVQELIKHKAKVDMIDNDGDTALMGAVHEGRIPCVQLLLQAGANPKHKNNAGQTAHDLTQELEDENIREKILILLNEQITQ